MKNRLAMRNLILLFTAIALLSSCNSSKKTTSTDGTFLTGTEWTLIKVKDVMDNSTNKQRTLYVELPDKKGNGVFRGKGGCNLVNGQYDSNSGSKMIHFTNIISTRMTCDDQTKEYEYLKMLEAVNSYTVANKILKLYKGGELILTFQAK